MLKGGQIMRILRVTVGSSILLAALVVLQPPIFAKTDIRNMQKVAVFDFLNTTGGELSGGEVRSLVDLVRGASRGVLEVDGYMLFTRDNLITLLPPGKTMGDCVGECAVETGQRIGADYVVTGEVTLFGDELRVSMSLYDTKTGNLLNQVRVGAREVLDLEGPLEVVTRGMYSNLSGGVVSPGYPEGEVGSGRPVWELNSIGGIVTKFDSNPPGALVEVDGVPICSTPSQRALAPGFYRVSMKLGRYLPREELIEVREGLDSILWELKPNFGWLTAHTRPDSAAVSINGSSYGFTPLNRIELSPGAYEITIEDPRFYPKMYRITLDRGEQEELDVALEPRLGALRIEAVNSRGDAVNGEVLFNGVKVGRAWESISSAVGCLAVEVWAGDYIWRGEVEVSERETAIVPVEMVQLRLSQEQRDAIESKTLRRDQLRRNAHTHYLANKAKGTRALVIGVGASGLGYLCFLGANALLDDSDDGEDREPLDALVGAVLWYGGIFLGAGGVANLLYGGYQLATLQSEDDIYTDSLRREGLDVVLGATLDRGLVLGVCYRF